MAYILGSVIPPSGIPPGVVHFTGVAAGENITPNLGNTSFTIRLSDTYEITLNIPNGRGPGVAYATTPTFQVFVNNIATGVIVDIVNGWPTAMGFNVLLDLTAGDVVDVRNISAQTVQLPATTTTSVMATLTIESL